MLYKRKFMYLDVHYNHLLCFNTFLEIFRVLFIKCEHNKALFSILELD